MMDWHSSAYPHVLVDPSVSPEFFRHDLTLLIFKFSLCSLGFLFVLGFGNALVIILPNTITLGTVTTIDFVGSTGDPAEWILVNVYENGTTQIGSSTFSGSGSTTMTFQLEGQVELKWSVAFALSDRFLVDRIFSKPLLRASFLLLCTFNPLLPFDDCRANGVLSLPFYSGNFFIPVDPSAPSSTSSMWVTFPIQSTKSWLSCYRTTVTQTVQVSTFVSLLIRL